jgi:hypothetical protein
MTATVKVNATDILRWARYLNEMPKRTRPAMARAINAYGEGVADSTAEMIAGRTGLDPHEIRSLIDIKEATPDNLTWEMDATAVAPPPQDWQRPWENRSNKQFEQPTLVKIITSGDDHTCEICQEAAAKSPYTMDEINALSAKWKHWEPPAGAIGERTNLLHPNCRCAIQPWRETRRVSMQFGGKSAPPELLNSRQLGRRIADELKVAIRVLRSR